MNKKIAVITARGGSKRIPRKNIKEFFGQPMIKYAIDAARESKIFDTVMVSTDDEEIAQIAMRYGADIPFMRSLETSNDFATTYDVLAEVINQYQKRNIGFDTLCCIYPCVPFLKSDTLLIAYKKFVNNNADALMPVVNFSYPIQRALHITCDELLKYAHPEYTQSRSQNLEAMYHDVGMFYIIKTKVLLEKKTLVPVKTTPYIMNELEVQDIDTMEDWAMAELKYKLLKKSEAPCFTTPDQHNN